MKKAIYALTCMFASVCAAQPPPAPAITVAATDIKQLQFDITPVTRVNWYELWFKANPGASWVKYSEKPAQRPRFRINTSVHLLDWQQARYLVKACNPSGCASSSEVGVDGEQLDAMGYFKPATTGSNQWFGSNFALSADGSTLVAVAFERIDATTRKAGIHVYRKTTATSGWRLDARFSPTPAIPSQTQNDGEPLAVSADGNTLVFGNSIENGYAGAVYVFRRAADGWHQTQRIGSARANDHFGTTVKLDSAGKTLVVARHRDDSDLQMGTLEVYQDPDDGIDDFVHATTIAPPPFDTPDDASCRSVDISDEGHIVHSCANGVFGYAFTRVLTAISTAPLQYVETARLPGIGGDAVIDSAGQHIAVHEYGFNDLGERQYVVGVYRRDSTGWVADGVLKTMIWNSIAMSGDGKFIASADMNDQFDGKGPLFPPWGVSADATGTVAVYERRSSGWALRRLVKAGNHTITHSFGAYLTLDQFGKTLAVGSPYDPSKATGVDGDREDASVSQRGAVWLY